MLGFIVFRMLNWVIFTHKDSNICRFLDVEPSSKPRELQINKKKKEQIKINKRTENKKLYPLISDHFEASKVWGKSFYY